MHKKTVSSAITASLLLISLILQVIIYAGSATPAAAQQIHDVTYDVPDTGYINAAYPEQDWYFSAPSKDLISYTIVPAAMSVQLTADFDTLQKVPIIPHVMPGQQFMVPGKGRYKLVVKAASPKLTVNGQYSLTVNLLGSGGDNPAFSNVGDEFFLATDLPAVTLTNNVWSKTWSMHMSTDDYRRFDFQRLSGDLVAEFSIFSDDGTMIGTTITGDTASMTLTFPKLGLYYVQVRRVGGQMGTTTGQFTVKGTLVGLGEDAPVLNAIAGRVFLNIPRPGALNPLRWKDTWVLQLDTPQALQMTANRTQDILVPQIRLLDANNSLLVQSVPDLQTGNTSLSTRILPAGQYYVVVSRSGDASGLSTGGYLLTVKSAVCASCTTVF